MRYETEKSFLVENQVQVIQLIDFKRDAIPQKRSTVRDRKIPA